MSKLQRKKTSSEQPQLWYQREVVLLALILLGAFILRLYRIHYPLADWHSWRQADTASVTREYVKHGIDLLHPRYHDLSSLPNYRDNSAEGYRMVEFPFVNASIALLLKMIPVLPLVPTSRFISIIASLGTLLCVYGIVRKLNNQHTAYLAAISFASIPYIVYYSRVILPEPFMLFFSTLSLLTFLHWTEKPTLTYLMLSACSLSLAILLKPFVLFLAPVYATMLFTSSELHTQVFHSKYSIRHRLQLCLQLSLFAVIAFVPLYFWRTWIAQFPEGIPASSWLFNGNGIRFRPAWVRWLGYERLTKLVLGYTGILFLPFAFLKLTKSTAIYFSWWVGIALYFSVIATGNVQHDYYQVLFTPIVAITLAVGIVNFFEILTLLVSKKIALGSIMVLLGLMYYFSWQNVKGYFNVNHWEYVEAGQAVDKLTPADAKVIAPAYGGDTYFLFQTNRRGWPFLFPVEELIAKGATHYVSTDFNDETNNLMTRFETVEKTDKYIILNLTQPL